MPGISASVGNQGRGSGNRQKVQFACGKEGPKIYMQEVYERAETRSVFGCLICGDLVDAKVGIKCVSCVGDHRIMHTHCIEKLGLDKGVVRCNQIREHLVPIKRGKDEVRWKTDMSEKQEYAH